MIFLANGQGNLFVSKFYCLLILSQQNDRHLYHLHSVWAVVRPNLTDKTTGKSDCLPSFFHRSAITSTRRREIYVLLLSLIVSITCRWNYEGKLKYMYYTRVWRYIAFNSLNVSFSSVRNHLAHKTKY